MISLVTGATGFVGSAVARHLRSLGHDIRVLARSGADRRNLEGLDAELVTGDITDPDAVRRAVAGCHYVFHVAADYRLWVPDPAPMMAANVDAAVDVCRAAAEAGAERIVYCSSVAVLGLPKDGTPGDEETPVTFADMIGVYKQSKYRGEEAVRRLIADTGAPVVIVNPSTPIGPRDIKPTPTGRMIVDAARGRMPAYVDTGLNVVHVDDVARGHWLACTRGEIGRRYVLGGENMALADILKTVAELTGRRPPKVKLPHDLIMPIAHAAEWFGKATGREPFVNVDSVRMARKRMWFSWDRARRELGYQPRPAHEALADAVAWFRANGCLDG